MIHFGIGCFHFAYIKKVPYDFRLRDYYAALKAKLNSIATISNVVLETSDLDDSDLDASEVQRIDESPLGLENGTLFPYPMFLSITFDVYLPRHIQKQLINREWVDTGCEKFRVYIQHEYHMPICFIQLLKPEEDCDPSSAIQIVREYLKSEINKDDSNICFEILGPSPFHADFSVELSDFKGDPSTEFKVNIEHPPGYAEIQFNANQVRFSNIESAFTSLRSYLADELDLFYREEQLRVIALDGWQEIDELVEFLVSSKTRLSFFERITRRWRQGRIIQEVNERLARFEAHQIRSSHELQKSFEEDYTRTKMFLKSYVEHELKHKEVFPSRPTAELLQFLEKRRSKATELLVVLVAAVIGGMAGSLVTILYGQASLPRHEVAASASSAPQSVPLTPATNIIIPQPSGKVK